MYQNGFSFLTGTEACDWGSDCTDCENEVHLEDLKDLIISTSSYTDNSTLIGRGQPEYCTDDRYEALVFPALWGGVICTKVVIDQLFLFSVTRSALYTW